jgi:hypothetical protein
MDDRCLSRVFFFVLTVFVTVVSLTGCAAKHDVWGDPQSGLVLSYRVTGDRALNYQTTVEMTQTMETMGRSRSFGSTKATDFSLVSKGREGDDLELEITIERMSVEIQTPRGEINRDLKEVEGKSFAMNLSPLGGESNLSGAEEVMYQIPPLGPQNVASDFQAIFPDLAGRPVRVGESWTTSQTIADERFESEAVFELTNENTLEGLETIDGIECAKITSRINGTWRTTEVSAASREEVLGTLTGTGVWYFAYREGLLVQFSTTTRTSGRMRPAGQAGLSVNTTQETSTETRLIR